MDDEGKLNEFLMKYAKRGSGDFIKFAETLGITFDGIEKTELARKLAAEQFGISEKEFTAVDFVFWISYTIERNSKDLIVFPEIGVGIRLEFVEYLQSLLSKHQKKELKSKLKAISDVSLKMDFRKESLEYVIDALSLGNKISIIEKFYSSEKNTPFIQLMRNIKDLRNDISHGRIDNLTYKSLPLSYGKGQIALFTDLLHIMASK